MWDPTGPQYFKKKCVKSFDLSDEETSNKNEWRLRIKEATILTRFNWKTVYVFSDCLFSCALQRYQYATKELSCDLISVTLLIV